MSNITLNPSGYNANHSSYSTISSSYPISNGYADTSSTSYTRVTCQSNNNTLAYTFDMSSIPAGATIDSVSCKAKGSISSTSYISAATFQLYAGTTAKGSSTSFRSASASVYTLSDCGSWTRDELDELELHVKATKSGSSWRSAYIYFYGAELTITYTLGKQYTVTISANEGGTTDPSGDTIINENDSFNLSIYPNDGYNVKRVTKNGTEVTLQEETETGVQNGVCLVKNDFIDELSLSTLTNHGVTVSTAQSKFGGKSLHFDGSSYLALALPQDNKPCTIEMWIYPTKANTSGSYPTIFSSATSNSSGGTYMHIDDGSYSTNPVCRANSSSSSSNNGSYGTTAITRNTWHHIAMCYDGSGNHYFFLDGVLQATVSQRSPNSYQSWYIGCLYNGSSASSGCYFEGYMEDILVSSICKWTGNFTVPSAEYGATDKTYYTYSIDKVTENVSIIVVFEEKNHAVLYVNDNGNWKAVQMVLQKIDGQWTKQTDLESVFDELKRYVIGEV